MTQENQGLPTDTVLDLDGGLAGSTPVAGGFDEIAVNLQATEAVKAADEVDLSPPGEAAQTAGSDSEGEAARNAEEKGIGYLPNSTTTQQDHEVFCPIGSDWDDAAITIVGLADTRERTRQAIDNLPNIDPTATQSGREWTDYLIRSLESAPGRDQWREALDREGSAWRQQIDSERGPLRMGALTFKNLDGAPLRGEKAVLQVRALIGLGAVIQVPLWHSGFHVSIKAPSESQMIELNRRLLDEKIVVGRTTNGLAYANTSSYITGPLLDFVMDYIYDFSLQEKDKDTVRSMIQAPDLPLLFWGLACSIWPRGFQYARPYIDPITKAEKILKERLMVSKLLWVDTKAFNAWQISHMANRNSGTMSAAMVQRYRAEFTIGQPRRVQLTDAVAVTLKVPSAVEYVSAGQKWIAEITKTVDDAFAEPAEDGRRANYIVRQGQATAMRQYTHWVQSIEAGPSTISDMDTIESILNDLSSDDAIRSKFFEEVRKYIDDSSLAVIGTPAALHEEREALPRFPHILPLNVEHTFFTLLDQKVMQVIQRI
jgi:hypothetical protein